MRVRIRQSLILKLGCIVLFIVEIDLKSNKIILLTFINQKHDIYHVNGLLSSGYLNPRMIDIGLLQTYGAGFRDLQKNEELFREGGECQYYHQLVEGELRWVNLLDDGKEYLQTLVEPGQCVGELPLFDNRPYAASAYANVPSRIIRLPKARFLELLEQNPEIHIAFTRLLTDRLRFKFFLVKEMAADHPEKLILSLLNYFRVERMFVCDACQQVKLTRQQIANFTGLRVETVIRAIRNLHERGVLQIEGGKVYHTSMIPIIG